MACCKREERQSSEFEAMTYQQKQHCAPVKTTGWFGSTKYDNPWDEWKKPGAKGFLYMKLTSRNQAGIPSKDELDESLPVHFVTEKEKKKLNSPPKSDIQIMWIGHATLLVQFDDVTVLTDPVFLDRCVPSPIVGVGPKRYRPVPCKIIDLPRIDAVIISHNHYDHLEHDAVLQLNDKNIKWFVPMGLKSWFIDSGCETSNIFEMTWWETKEQVINENSPTKFICVPAQHWSQRTPTDAMTSLWCGWVVKTDKHTFYYSGDTGYCPVFKEIGEKFGPMDLSAIPIGCYEPRYFMKPQHIGPDEAVLVHKDVKSKKSVGIHWGTFNGLGSHEFYLEPQTLLQKEVEKNTDVDFFTVKHGEIKVIETAVKEIKVTETTVDDNVQQEDFVTVDANDANEKNEKQDNKL